MKIYASRLDAGRRLAEALAAYRGRQPLVLALPRGAVPMAALIADALGGDLDVVLVRKLRAPFSEELAVGAVDESGWTYIAPYADQVDADPKYLEREKRAQMEVLARRRELYTPARAPLDARGRIVIVVDDGLATGASMIAALHSVRARKPGRLVCAVPVASPDSLEQVRSRADAVVCLLAPRDFRSVGQYYQEFPQVGDDEVVRVLSAHRAHPLHNH